MTKRLGFDIEDSLKQVKGTLAIEGLTLEKKGEDLLRKKLAGTISEEEFMKKVLEISHES